MANRRFYIRQNDTAPPISAQLFGTDGELADLTGATAKFQMTKAEPGATIKVNAAATIDTANSIATYSWLAVDTDETGTFNATFQITYSGGAIQSFPSDRFIAVIVTPDLGP